MLELACFCPVSGIAAGNAGVDRIELCDQQSAGGITPPLEWLIRVKSQVVIPVFVMVRPRGGDFVYTEAEFRSMQTTIDEFKDQADGFVFGILDTDRKIDVARTADLVRRAQPFPCTFHRAFDDTVDPYQALEDVIATGCDSILSSGTAPTALEGVNVLKDLVRLSKGRITVIPGGGIRSENLARIRLLTGAAMFHSSAIIDGGIIPDVGEIHRMQQLLHDPEDLEISSRHGATSALTREGGQPMAAVSVGALTALDDNLNEE